jgi:FdhE protein
MERAHVLEREYPAAAEFLRFYREIARFQKQLAQTLPPVTASTPVFSLDPDKIPDLMGSHADALLELLTHVAPLELAQTATVLARMSNWDAGDPAVRFVTRVLVQPYAEHMARGTIVEQPSAVAKCPFCDELPVASVLRPEGKRSLVCSLCSTEWAFRRLLCPKCGEEDQRQLPVYTAEPFPHVRIEACDTCRTYLKAIDMTRDGLAVPEVDEMASLPLDLWAAENHYVKLKSNLFGL